MKRGLRGLEEQTLSIFKPVKNEEVVQRVNVLKYAPNVYLELQAMGLHRLQPTPPVECLTQRRREAESAENARNLANTMSYASNLLEAKHRLKGETTNCSGNCDKTTNLQFSQHSLPLCASA